MRADRQEIADKLILEMETALMEQGILHRIFCGYQHTKEGEGYYSFQINDYKGNKPPLMRNGGGRYRFRELSDKVLKDIRELDSRPEHKNMFLKVNLEVFERHPEWKEKYKMKYLDCLYS